MPGAFLLLLKSASAPDEGSSRPPAGGAALDRRAAATGKPHDVTVLSAPVPTRQRPTAVLVPVYLSTVLSIAAYSVISVALPFRFQALGLNVFQYGIVMAIFALGMLLTEGVWGALAYRVANAVWILVLGSLGAVALAAVGFSTDEWEFAVVFGLLGALMVFSVPLMRWVALVAGGPGTGGTGTGRYAVFFGLGIVLGSTIGPGIYVAVGFLRLCEISVALWLGSTVALMVVPWSRLEVADRRTSLLRQMRRVLTPYFGVVALLVTLYFTCNTLTSSFLQYYSVSLFGGTATESGYVIGASRATGLVAGFALGMLVDRWGPAKSTPFGFLLLATGAAGTFFAQSYAEMIGATLCFAVGAGWLSADLLPLALLPVHRDLQGTAVGVFGSFEDLGLLVGPVLIGGVYSAYGAHAIFLVVMAVAVGAMAISAGVGSFMTGQIPVPPEPSSDSARPLATESGLGAK